MRTVFYPAVFKYDENQSYQVSFPDFPCFLTCGNDISQAYEGAVIALRTAYLAVINKHQEVPEPSLPQNITLNVGETLVMIPFDMLSFWKDTMHDSVDITVSLPQWLVTAAESSNINLSRFLQKTLKEYYNISDEL